MSDVDHQQLEEFVPRVELQRIDCIECRARSTAQLSPDVEPPTFTTQPSFQLRIRTPDEDERSGWFFIDIRVVIEFEEGDATVAHRAIYEHPAENEPSVQLLTKFTNEVAAMHLLPYLREALADVTRRVFDQPLMIPMIQRGELSFPVPQRTSTHEA